MPFLITTQWHTCNRTIASSQMTEQNHNETANWNNHKPSLEEVDKLADELANEYKNTGFRPWYCNLIYSFGFEQVRIWQARSKDAENPGRLFSKLASEAKKKRDGLEKLQALKNTKGSLYEK